MPSIRASACSAASLLLLLATLSAEEPQGGNVPVAVTKVLAEQFDGATIKKVKRKTKDFLELYEFRLADDVNGDKEFKVVIDEKGGVQEEEERRVAVAKVPDKVREAFRLWCGGEKIETEWSVKRADGGLRAYKTGKVKVMGGEDYFLIHVPSDLSILDLKTYARGEALKQLEAAAPVKTPEKTVAVEPKDPPPLPAEIDPDVVNKVRKLIRGTLKEDDAAREEAWKALRDMGNLAVPGLVAVYRAETTTPEMVKSILIALGDSKDARAGPALVEILGSKDVGSRALAARGIGDSNYKDGVGALKERMFDPKEQEEVILYAAASAAKLGSASGAESLKTLMKSSKAETRTRALYALGKHAGKQHVEALAEGLKDQDAGVRMDAVEALRLVGGKEVWGVLVDATKDADYKIRGSAMDALRELTKQKIGNEPKEWQDWWAKQSSSKPAEGKTAPAGDEYKTMQELDQEGKKRDLPDGGEAPSPRPAPQPDKQQQ